MRCAAADAPWLQRQARAAHGAKRLCVLVFSGVEVAGIRADIVADGGERLAQLLGCRVVALHEVVKGDLRTAVWAVSSFVDGETR